MSARALTAPPPIPTTRSVEKTARIERFPMDGRSVVLHSPGSASRTHPGILVRHHMSGLHQVRAALESIPTQGFTIGRNAMAQSNKIHVAGAGMAAATLLPGRKIGSISSGVRLGGPFKMPETLTSGTLLGVSKRNWGRTARPLDGSAKAAINTIRPRRPKARHESMFRLLFWVVFPSDARTTIRMRQALDRAE